MGTISGTCSSDGGALGHDGEEARFVRGDRGLQVFRRRVRGEASELLQAVGRVSHQQVLGAGVEGLEHMHRGRGRDLVAEPFQREDPLDEVLSDVGVVQAAVLFARQAGKGADEGAGEEPRGVLWSGIAVGGVKRDTEESRGGRLGSEDEAMEIERPQRFNGAVAKGHHLFGIVGACFVADKAVAFRRADQMHRLARHRESAADLRTDGNIVEIRAQRVGQVGVVFMAAVEADLLAE